MLNLRFVWSLVCVILYSHGPWLSTLVRSFPSKLKLAKVITFFKKGDRTSIENYRPISLLPCISKVLEKTIYIQFYDYSQYINLLYKSQYGFRKHHSTEFASLELVDTIQQQLDLKLDPFAVFLDMSNAFDTLDHEILQRKLSSYGVQNTSLNLFKSYFSETSQFVSMGGTSSPLRTINTGVPPRIDPGTTPVYNIHQRLTHGY